MKKRWVMLAVLAALLLAGLDQRLLVQRYSVPAAGIAAPVRLALVTDFHGCSYGPDARDLVDAIAADFLVVDESTLTYEYTTGRSSEVYHNLIDGKVDVIFAAEISEEDKREYRLVLTDKYYNYIKMYEDSFKAAVLEAEEDVPDEKLLTLMEALDKMDTAL